MKIGDYFLIINDAKAEFLIVRLQYFVIDALQRHNDYVVTLHVIISMSIIMWTLFTFCYKTTLEGKAKCIARLLKTRVKKGRAVLLSESESSIYEGGQL